MSVDLEEIQKAISRVRERSTGPGTVDHLAALLSEARRELVSLPVELANLKSQLATVQEQAVNKCANAEKDKAAARDALAAAKALDAAHQDMIDIAQSLGYLMAECDAMRKSKDELADALTTAHVDAERAGTTALKEAAQLRAECDAVRASDATKQATLARIAQLPWWKVHLAQRIARAESSS